MAFQADGEPSNSPSGVTTSHSPPSLNDNSVAAACSEFTDHNFVVVSSLPVAINFPFELNAIEAIGLNDLPTCGLSARSEHLSDEASCRNPRTPASCRPD